MQEFLSDKLWNKVGELSKKAKSAKVAVAYFGTGASELVNLKHADVLIVAMDMANVIAGQVNPFEIEKLYKVGVAIYNLPNLHSKIFVFDNKVIVGSANISKHSVNQLIETGILTDDKTIVSEANAFILKYSVEKIEQDYIELCKKNYNPPKIQARRKVFNEDSFRGQLSNLWVISTEYVDWFQEDEIILRKDKEYFESKISDHSKFELEEIKYRNSEPFINKVKEGDIIIEIIKHTKRTQVVSPKRVLGVTRDVKRNVSFLRTEKDKAQVIKSWSGLSKILLQNQVKYIKRTTNREIKNNNVKKILLSYFS